MPGFPIDGHKYNPIQVYQADIGKHSQKKLPHVPEPSAGCGWELAQNEDLIIMFYKCIQGCHFSDSSCIHIKSIVLLVSYKIVQTCQRKQFNTNRDSSDSESDTTTSKYSVIINFTLLNIEQN